MSTPNQLLDAYFNDPSSQTTFGQSAQQTDYTQYLNPGFDATGATQTLSGILGGSQTDTGGFLGSAGGGFNFDPSALGTSSWDSNALNSLDPAAKQKLFDENLGQQDGGVWDGLKGFFKNNQNEIFSTALKGAGMGVLSYLAERRKARDKMAEIEATKAMRNEDVARASAVPVVGSMIKPNAPRSVGLLGQVKKAV